MDRGLIYSIILPLVPPHLMEDAISEAQIALLQSPLASARLVIRRRVIDFLRRELGRTTRPVFIPLGDYPASPIELPDHIWGIPWMTPRQAACVMLLEQGLSFDQVAAAMGIGKSAVHQLTWQARRRSKPGEGTRTK